MKEPLFGFLGLLMISTSPSAAFAGDRVKATFWDEKHNEVVDQVLDTPQADLVVLEAKSGAKCTVDLTVDPIEQVSLYISLPPSEIPPGFENFFGGGGALNDETTVQLIMSGYECFVRKH
ncbi:hypothetical protein K2X30_13830 [bacterium]|jgi:hypothetical protein|nr:hypothetical protein [bacterium]